MMFPIHSWDVAKFPDCPEEIPWAFAERIRQQAEYNHGQTLERLAERGGLGITEFRLAYEGKTFLGQEFSDERSKEDLKWLLQELSDWEFHYP